MAITINKKYINKYSSTILFSLCFIRNLNKNTRKSMFKISRINSLNNILIFKFKSEVQKYLVLQNKNFQVFESSKHYKETELINLIFIFFTIIMMCLVTQSCLNLCDPLDCSPPGTLSIEFPRQEYWSGLPLYLCKTKNTEDMVKVSCIYYLSCALWIKCFFFLIAYYI